jgi:hypothetical protein
VCALDNILLYLFIYLLIYLLIYLQTRGDVKCSKALILASEHLEKRVMTPLQELSRRIRYRIDVLQDAYTAQLELVEGPQNTGSAGAGKAHPQGSQGIKSKLRELVVRHEELKARMDAIKARAASQSERVALLYSGALRTKSRLSQPELNYKRELSEWHNMIRLMETNIEALRRRAKEGDKVKATHAGLRSPQQIASQSSSSAQLPAEDRNHSVFSPGTPSTGTRAAAPTLAYRSPGFGSGPSSVYRSGSGAAAGVAPKTPVSGRWSAYAASSPATRTLSTPQRSVAQTPGSAGVGAGASSPLPIAREGFLSAPRPPLVPSEEPTQLSESEIASYGRQLRSQQSLLNATMGKVVALEARVRELRALRDRVKK